jgi:arylsulfatase
MNTAMDTTPNLDEMATDSLVFENAIAPGPRTPSSIPEIFTREPLPKRTEDSNDWREALMQSIAKHLDQHETIAEQFKQRGYSTAAYTANPWTLRSTNFDTGFDQFHEIGSDSTGSLERLFSGTIAETIARLGGQWWRKEDWFSQWRTFYSDLEETVNQLTEPYFLWVFLLDAHNPYIAPKQDRRESNTFGTYYSVLRGNSVVGDDAKKTNYREHLPPSIESRIKRAYRDTIRSVDQCIDTLRSDTANEEPIIVLHADHGEGFGEHGTYGHQPELYEENIHVPLLIYNCESTTRVAEPISLRLLPDILTTVASGADEPARFTSENVCSRTDDNVSMAVRSERWKLIVSDEDEELYDLTNDPGENRNVIESEEKTAVNLRMTLESFVEELPEDSLAEKLQGVSNDITDRLESLGYK